MADTSSFFIEERLKCQTQRRVPTRIISFVSLAACIVALASRAHGSRPRSFKFPENAFVIGLASLVVCHLAMLIGVFDGNAHLEIEAGGQRALCQVQAVLLHWSLVSLMLNAIYVVIALFRLVVHRAALSAITHATRLHYFTVLAVPSITVLACATIGQGYTFADDDDLCWIKSAGDRMVYHLSFMVLGVTTTLCLTPSLLRSLFRAYRTVDNQARARIFLTMMIRLMAVAFYVVILFSISLLTSLNQAILQNSPAASGAARYARKTLLSYCLVRSFVVSSMGLVVASLLSVRKHHIRKAVARLVTAVQLCRRRRPSTKIETRDMLADGSGHVASDSTSDNDAAQPSATSSQRSSEQLLCASAAESGGRTAVSVPPDPGHHRAHLIATQAYTSYVLEHAREQLTTQRSMSSDSSQPTFDSGMSGSSFLSHASYMSATTPRRRKSSAGSGDIKIVSEPISRSTQF